MSGARSRAKGIRGELEWACWLQETFGLDARRGCQYRGGQESPDVDGGIPSTHCEVKRAERLRLWEALEQAVRDAPDGSVPYVAYRANRRPWLVILRARDLADFARLVVEALEDAHE